MFFTLVKDWVFCLKPFSNVYTNASQFLVIWESRGIRGLKLGTEFLLRSVIEYGKSQTLVRNRVRFPGSGRTPSPNTMGSASGQKTHSCSWKDKRNLGTFDNYLFLWSFRRSWRSWGMTHKNITIWVLNSMNVPFMNRIEFKFNLLSRKQTLVLNCLALLIVVQILSKIQNLSSQLILDVFWQIYFSFNDSMKEK